MEMGIVGSDDEFGVDGLLGQVDGLLGGQLDGLLGYVRFDDDFDGEIDEFDEIGWFGMDDN